MIRAISAVAAFISIILLTGCPPTFPGCPLPPSLDFNGFDAGIVGVWTGEAATPISSGRTVVYNLGMIVRADHSFELTAHDEFGLYTVDGTWAVDRSAMPIPRIQFGIACSDLDRFPASSWLRGVYSVGSYETIDNLQLVERFTLGFQVAIYPDPAIIDEDSGYLIWSLYRDEPR